MPKGMDAFFPAVVPSTSRHIDPVTIRHRNMMVSLVASAQCVLLSLCEVFVCKVKQNNKVVWEVGSVLVRN